MKTASHSGVWFVWMSVLMEGLLINSAEQTRSVSRLSTFLSLFEIKNVKVKGIFKYCILWAFQWCIVSLGFFKNNANKSDFRKDSPKGCRNVDSNPENISSDVNNYCHILMFIVGKSAHLASSYSGSNEGLSNSNETWWNKCTSSNRSENICDWFEKHWMHIFLM